MGRLGELVRTVLSLYFVAHDFVIWLLSHLVRHGRLVREDVVGSDPLASSKRVAIYVHFDGDGLVHDYVVHQLGELRQSGFRIVFVSNSPIFPEASRARILPLCARLMWRHNTGYDFGAYKDGIASLGDLGDLDSLLLMNDSIYGPFRKLGETLAAADPLKYDFWGIADSWEHQYHLQTFFVLFHPRALHSAAFKRFWHRHPYIGNKGWVIRNGEVMLTQQLARQRLRGGALVPYWQAAEKMKDRLGTLDTKAFSESERVVFDRLQMALLRGRPINSMHYFWDLAIEEFGCPFIKRELLKANPAGIFKTSQWPDVISSRSDYDVSLIKRHLGP
ncbi:rhamnan synthesis F family protein [Rhodopseudomonas sp. RCAM05734]|uniref:rhamnan synthesis F family protein n=1 Tax=Rhodopseudomonas sp. RCAM05734 TaxID=3457549 RepID=UPI004044B0A2